MELQKYSDDFTQEERKSLEDYINNGCPSLVSLNETKMFEWFELYMSGKTYEEISNITNGKKDLILYVSYKSKWNESRTKYLIDLNTNLANKIAQTKLESINTVQTIVSALGKNIENKMNDYLKTKDESIMANMSKDDLKHYFKGLEVFDKLTTEPNKGTSPNPPVTINIGSNSTVVQSDNSTLDVNTSNAEKLRKLAEEKRSKE